MTLRRWRRKEWGYTWGSNYIKLLPQAVITKSTYPLRSEEHTSELQSP